MRVAPRTILTGVLLATAVQAFAAAAPDALFVWDEFNARRYTILNCHQSQSEADQTYLAKGDVLQKAAFDQLKAQLDAADPAHREENTKKTEETMQNRQKIREFAISEQIRNYGCEWLDDQFRLANP